MVVIIELRRACVQFGDFYSLFIHGRRMIKRVVLFVVAEKLDNRKRQEGIMPSSMAAPLMDDFCEHFDRVVSNNQVGVVSDMCILSRWVGEWCDGTLRSRSMWKGFMLDLGEGPFCKCVFNLFLAGLQRHVKS